MDKIIKHVGKSSSSNQGDGIIWCEHFALYDDGTWESVVKWRWPLAFEYRAKMTSAESFIGKTRDELKTYLNNIKCRKDPEFIIMI